MWASNVNNQSFFKRRDMRITGVYVYIVNIQKNESHGLWSQHFMANKQTKKKLGKNWQPWQIFFSWAPKSLWIVTEAMKLKDFSPWKKSCDNTRQCIRKDCANRGPNSQSYGFLVGTYRCESWTERRLSTEEHAFRLWCWWRLLRVPWTARSSNPSILKEINPENIHW